MNKDEKQKFIYIKAPEDFYDLEDLFNGKYFKSYKRWRFTKEQEQEVLSYLEVDEKLVSELNDRAASPQSSSPAGPLVEPPKVETKSKRLHRSNSFNASEDDEDEKRPIPTKSMISYRKKQMEREKKDLEFKISQV